MTRTELHNNKRVKKYLFFILQSLFFITLTSCEINSSDNGDLDNWWYLRQVDNLTDGTTTDYVEKKVFWSYIGKIMQTEGGGAGKFLFRFEQKAGTLRIYEPRDNARGSSDPQLTETELTKLNAQGIHMKAATDSDGNILTDSDGNTIYEETFTVEQLNSDRMTLLNEDKTLRLHFEAW